MLRPGSLLSRTLALVLLVALGLAGHRLVVAPVLTAYRDVELGIEQQQALLLRYQRLAAERQDLAKLVTEQEELAAGAAGYLRGPSDALATAELQNRVKAVVEGAAGSLRSTQSLQRKSATDDEGTARRAAVKARFSVDIEGLAKVLYELETGEPYLVVEELMVREVRQRRRRNEPDPKPMLDITVDVVGYLRAGKA
jgi:general secretion pathway protein M